MLNITKNTIKNAAVLKHELGVSYHLNIVGHFDDTTLIDKDGRLIKLFEIQGIDYVTQDQLTLDVYKNRRNSFFKNFTSTYALYSWTLRSRTRDYPEGEYQQPFAQLVNAKYRTNFEKTLLFQNKHVLALVTKAPEGKINQVAHWLKSLNMKTDPQAKQRFLAKTHQELQQVTNKLLSVFKHYHIRPLGTVHINETLTLSEPLSFIGQLINSDEMKVPLRDSSATHFLPRKRLFFNARSGTIEIRGADQSRKFGALLSIKGYANNTFAGLLDGIQRLPIECIITQSYRFFDPQATKTKVKNQQKDFQQINDESLSQTEKLGDALDEAASGESGFGMHYLSVFCLSDNIQHLNKIVADIVAEFSKLDIYCVREDIACETAFWSQLPGNFIYIPPRDAPISTKNLAGFISLHNDALGHLKNNHWGPAISVLETISGSPYYFNHHYKDVGNTLIFGSMGSGKTTLMGFLLTQGLKHGGKRVVFDKDRGLEILVRALGGTYEILKPGLPTGFNPCQLPDTAENRIFLNELFKKMLSTHGQTFDESDVELINKVVTKLYTLPESDRKLCHIAPYFGPKKRGSLRLRFEEWHTEGVKAWLFDNEHDSLYLDADILGFDFGSILNDEECKTPASMYLMHRVNQAMYGQRGAVFADEGWKLLNDEYFRKELEDQSRTPRKKNKFLCLATQSTDDAANSSINETLCTSAACKIFFPNPSAKRSIYMDKLGLSEREFELIKTLDTDGRYFLLNYGYGKESVVLRVNLQDMNDEIAVISGREETVKLLDELRKEVGDQPEQWLPLFHKRRKPS